MFTYLDNGDLEALIAAGGKKGKGANNAAQEGKGKLEKVEYMQKEEIMNATYKVDRISGPENCGKLSHVRSSRDVNDHKCYDL